jgi:CBS domain-containing protein
MQVKDVMTSEIEFVTGETTLQEAAEKMKKLDVGELPVVFGKEAVGIVTDRDMVIRGIAHGHIPGAASVVEAMTQGVIACKEDDDLQKAAELMVSHKIRRLPVMNIEGKMTGVISLGDLAHNLDPARAGEVLREISK